MLWKLPIPPKLRLFCWRLLHDKLPKRLANWDPAISSCCLICRGGAESLEHLFVSSSFAIMVTIPDVPPSSPSLPPDIRFIVNEEQQRASAYTRAFYFPHTVAQDASSTTIRHQKASTSAVPRERWVVTTSDPQE
ncbi:hypothetical protein MRB53_009395 [Persea americana]|uniref:Uncharacterized protein n=1 Tax=Persea americana TaxID=3435 RepID=A0ACC2LPN3_PERAE|nr:hypothetical protein MRB53_009395 [Persea americana]